MIYDSNDTTCRCLLCGSVRFEITETYELKSSTDNRFDKSYEAFNPRTVIRCAECKAEYDKSTLSENIGLHIHK